MKDAGIRLTSTAIRRPRLTCAARPVQALRASRLVVVLVLVLAVAAIPGGASRAAFIVTSATTHLSLQAAPDVRSVTVSPASGAFGGCSGGDSASPAELGFPNGFCRVGGLVITNTGLRGHITVNGALMSPVGGGTPWVLCGSSDGVAPSCANGGAPGADQYTLKGPNGPGIFLSTQPQCDIDFSHFGDNCAALPGQSAIERFTLQGPQSTTNGASNYTTTVTWTAVP